MSPGLPKRRRIRLEPEPYHELRQEILQRDGWRCQSCGRRRDLQIHHIEARSRLGGDCEQNLITLCADCHQAIHRRCSSESWDLCETDSDRMEESA